jgi:hypothetical protein
MPTKKKYNQSGLRTPTQVATNKKKKRKSPFLEGAAKLRGKAPAKGRRGTPKRRGMAKEGEVNGPAKAHKVVTPLKRNRFNKLPAPRKRKKLKTTTVTTSKDRTSSRPTTAGSVTKRKKRY